MSFTKAPMSAVITDAVGNTVNLGNASGAFTAAPASIVLTDAAGNTLTIGASVPSSAGIGGYFAPVGELQNADGDTNTAVLSGANVVRVVQFALPYSVNVGHLVFNVATASAGGHCDVGIYDKSGNLLLHAGSTSTTATGNVNAVISPSVSLAPGVYYLAWTADNTAMQFVGVGTGQTHQTFLNVNGTRVGTAANAASAGVLPATLGAISTGAFNSVIALLEA